MEAHLQSIQTLTKPFNCFHRKVLTLVMDDGPEKQFSKSQTSRIQGCAHDQQCCFLRSVIGAVDLNMDKGFRNAPLSPISGMLYYPECLESSAWFQVPPGFTIGFCTVFQNQRKQDTQVMQNFYFPPQSYKKFKERMLLDQCQYYCNPNQLQPCTVHQLAKTKREAITRYAIILPIFTISFMWNSTSKRLSCLLQDHLHKQPDVTKNKYFVISSCLCPQLLRVSYSCYPWKFFRLTLFSCLLYVHFYLLIFINLLLYFNFFLILCTLFFQSPPYPFLRGE